MNQIEIYTRADGLHDFRIRNLENHKILCSSLQGYENMSDAIDTAQAVATHDYAVEITFRKED